MAFTLRFCGPERRKRPTRERLQSGRAAYHHHNGERSLAARRAVAVASQIDERAPHAADRTEVAREMNPVHWPVTAATKNEIGVL